MSNEIGEPISEDDPQVLRAKACFADILKVLHRHKMSAMLYLADIETLPNGTFSLYGQTQSVLWHLTEGQKQAMAAQALRHAKAAVADMLKQVKPVQPDGTVDGPNAEGQTKPPTLH